MKGFKEFIGNMPVFQKQVEREIEAKGIRPTEGVKKMETSRQVIRNIVVGVILIFIIAFVGIFYFQNKNNPTPDATITTTTSDTNVAEPNTTQSVQQSQGQAQADSDHLLKLSAEERADEATNAFKKWYESYQNNATILEVNEEMLQADSTGTSPADLQEKLINNLKAKFGDNVSDDFYTGLQTTFNFNPIAIDSTKGLTISKQNDDETQWLPMWFLDTEAKEKNTKIVLRNDIPVEWVDWRNKGQNSDKLGQIFNNVDWDNDMSYEVIGIDLTEVTKNIESNQILFIQMHYNDELSKWQVTGNIGGVF